MPQTQPCLWIDAEHQPDAYVIRVAGELDLPGCPPLELSLAEAEVSTAPRIVLDVEELAFIDARGLKVLLDASRRSARNGSRLQITRGSGFLADMFRLTALDRTLPLTEAALCPAIRGPGFAPTHNGHRLRQEAQLAAASSVRPAASSASW